MILKDISFSDPIDNILYDEALLQLAEQGAIPEVLRLWESSRIFIVLGRTSILSDDVHVEEVRRSGVPVLRRRSGGGTVIQGPGCLNFSLILSKKKREQIMNLHQSYRYVLERVAGALKTLGIEACPRPVSDLVLMPGEYKISGNAQHRGRNFILHHGTLLYDFDLSLIDRYLTFPKSVPEYRRGRSHQDFVRNFSIPVSSLRSALIQIFSAKGGDPGGLSEREKSLLKQLGQRGLVSIDA